MPRKFRKFKFRNFILREISNLCENLHQRKFPTIRYPDSSISKVLTILKWWMITMLNRKLVEKQRVQNHFASYEVHIDHFFYNINATASFGNRLTLSVFRFKNFSPDWQTDKLTNRRTKPIAHRIIFNNLYTLIICTPPFPAKDFRTLIHLYA